MLGIKPITLSNGVVMPPIVMSTFGLDYEPMKALVSEALNNGIRAFDTARKYGNEDIVGRVLQECLKEHGLSREDVFLTTKIFTYQQENGEIEENLDISLKNLKTDYLDLWLIHWPCPDYYLNTWKEMGHLYCKGKLKSIGLANPQIRHLEHIASIASNAPVHCVQMELHPFRTCLNLVSYCKEHNISVQAYTPLCKMIPKVRESPVLNHIATNHSCTIAQVILCWHFHKRYVPVFSTHKVERIKENIEAMDIHLSLDEIKLIDDLNENYKLLLESIYCPGY